ncbi:MAG: collagen binding domain-containing protein, partial [Nitrososphaerales archaeon]
VYKIGIITLGLLLIPIGLVYGEQSEGSLQINIKMWGGDLADYHGIVLKIYQDSSQTPMIVPLPSNPYNVSLPLDHRYKIEVYVNSMYANVDFVDLVNDNQKAKLNIPISGSVRFTVVNVDRTTPIEGASVSLRSGNGEYKHWTNSTTDESGNTIRFWIQPTLLKDDYYIAEVSIADGLSYVFSPITVSPGKSQEIKIITPWPKIIDHAIEVSVYKSPTERITGLQKQLVVEVYDVEQHKIASFAITAKGYAYFSNLKVGNYLFRVVDLEQAQNKELGSANVLLTGKQNTVQIFIDSHESQSLDVNPSITTKELATELSLKPYTQSWIKNISDWWASDMISDSELINAVEYLVRQDIIDSQYLDSN